MQSTSVFEAYLSDKLWAQLFKWHLKFLELCILVFNRLDLVLHFFIIFSALVKQSNPGFQLIHILDLRMEGLRVGIEIFKESIPEVIQRPASKKMI